MTRTFFHTQTRILLTAILLLSVYPALAIKAPDFKLPGDNNKDVELSKLKNKVVYVDFWASWCTPCKQSFPWMNQMQARYKDQGFEIIAINVDDDRNNAADFLNHVEANFTIAYDPKGATAQKYDLTVMPSSYLLNRKGELTYIHKGFKTTDKAEMEAKIKSLVNGK